MKVSELTPGVLIECANDDEVFSTSRSWSSKVDSDPHWLTVTKIWKKPHLLKRAREEKFIMYLGTKRDINIKMNWCDKFALIGDQIVGVDPSAWSKLRIVNESR